jgi:hypothetical protein
MPDRSVAMELMDKVYFWNPNWIRDEDKVALREHLQALMHKEDRVFRVIYFIAAKNHCPFHMTLVDPNSPNWVIPHEETRFVPAWDTGAKKVHN